MQRSIYASVMLLGAAQANQQFETFENLKVASLLE